MENNPKMPKKKTGEAIAIMSMIFGIIGMLTTCLGIGVILCLIGFILGFIVLIQRKPGKGLAITGLVTSSIGLFFALIILCIMAISGTKSKGSADNSEIQSASETTIDESVSETSEQMTIAEENESNINQAPTTIESEESYKSSCEEIEYKTLLRTPDDYIGKRIVITAKVQQIMQGGWFDDSQYYRIQTDSDGYDWYLDDEYFMYDFRVSDNIKILKEDVIKVYADFAGLEEVKRAISGVKEEIPAIKAYYIELISE